MTENDAVQSRPVLYSTFSSKAVKEQVLSNYDLGAAIECSLFRRGLNDTYLVSADDRRFALRLYRFRWRTREAVLGEVAALQHLSARGISVAAPIPRSDGALATHIDAPEGPRYAVLFQWVAGEEPSYTNVAHAQLYGRLAAQLHIAGDDLTPSGARAPLDFDYLLEKPFEALRPGFNSRPLLAVRFDALMDRLRIRVERAKAELQDWGFCHGDLHGGNAHCDNEHLTLYDFDCCGSGWRIYDLATYRWAARLRKVEDQAWKPFIEAYLKIRPTAVQSIRHVGLFVLLRHLWLQGYFAWNAVEGGAGFQNDQYFGDLVTFCERLESEHFAP
jgi:Ser/Thr protein kinase RdoA (MazF antagonist)